MYSLELLLIPEGTIESFIKTGNMGLVDMLKISGHLNMVFFPWINRPEAQFIRNFLLLKYLGKDSHPYYCQLPSSPNIENYMMNSLLRDAITQWTPSSSEYEILDGLKHANDATELTFLLLETGIKSPTTSTKQ